MADPSNYSPKIGDLVSTLGQEGAYEVVAVDEDSHCADLCLAAYRFHIDNVPWAFIKRIEADSPMKDSRCVLKVELADEGGVVVTFSDGLVHYVSAAYLWEHREHFGPISKGLQ